MKGELQMLSNWYYYNLQFVHKICFCEELYDFEYIVGIRVV